MGYDITTIKKRDLRLAAEKADVGLRKNAFNNKIDKDEIINFITNAEQSGCNIDYVNGIVSSVIPEKTDIINKKMTLYKEIQDSKNNIENLKKESQKYQNSAPKALGFVLGAGAGFGAGIITAGLLSGIFTVPTLLGLSLAAGGFIGGGLCGAKIGEQFESHEQKCAQKEKQQIAQQIQQEENRLMQLQEEFMSIK